MSIQVLLDPEADMAVRVSWLDPEKITKEDLCRLLLEAADTFRRARDLIATDQMKRIRTMDEFQSRQYAIEATIAKIRRRGKA